MPRISAVSLMRCNISTSTAGSVRSVVRRGYPHHSAAVGDVAVRSAPPAVVASARTLTGEPFMARALKPPKLKKIPLKLPAKLPSRPRLPDPNEPDVFEEMTL